MNKSMIVRLLPYLKKSRGPLLLALVSAIISVALSLLSPRLVGQGIDGLIAGQVDFSALTRIILLLLLVYGSAAVFQWLLSICANKACYRTVEALRGDTFRKIHRVPLKTIDGMPHGDIVARVKADAEA